MPQPCPQPDPRTVKLPDFGATTGSAAAGVGSRTVRPLRSRATDMLSSRRRWRCGEADADSSGSISGSNRGGRSDLSVQQRKAIAPELRKKNFGTDVKEEVPAARTPDPEQRMR